MLQILLCLLFFIVYFTFGSVIRSSELHSIEFRSEADVCQSEECVQSANFLLENMNQSANPCEDFYEFSCGGYVAKRQIPEDQGFILVYTDVRNEANLQLKDLLDKKLTGSEPVFVKNVKNLYDTCMDTQSIEDAGSNVLRSKLESLGGWPVVKGEKWDSSKFDWLDKIIEIRKLGYKHDLFMYHSVAVDSKNDTAHIINVNPPTVGVSEPFVNTGQNDSATTAYFNMMIAAADKLGANQAGLTTELMNVLQFEAALAKVFKPNKEKRDVKDVYTIRELQEMAPQIDWLKYFNGLYNTPLSPFEKIKLGVPEFISKFGELMQNADKRTIANYMMWSVVKFLMPYLSKEWKNLSSDTDKGQPHWEQCLDIFSWKLNLALSYYYVKNYFPTENKEKVSEMVPYVQREFISLLENADWMKGEAKSLALQKVNDMVFLVGYPEEMLDDALLMERYENLIITGESYVENVLNLNKWWTDKIFSKLRRRNIRGDWKTFVGSFYVNAYYNYRENNIEIPAAILQKYFFNKNRPYYMNFATIGASIGHEITHGFDNMGRRFNKEGKKENWWDENTDKLFKEKANCIIEQYGNFTTDTGLKLNGIKTQGENIADIGGLREAYKAYNTWVKDKKSAEPKLPGLNYTPNQMFWISAANVWCSKYKPEYLKKMIASNPHSPGRFRVLGPATNLEEFSADFNCPLGSPMNPQKKCKVW